MSPSRPFIQRPVATSLLMVAIVLAGFVGFRFLPLSALPQVDYPTIQVQTLYPGASPEVMSRTVTAPLERQFGQMSGLDRMSSTSAAGVSIITLQFTLGQTLDVAEQEVQAAINAGGSLLPADLPAPPVYAKVNPADAPVLTLAITSDTLPLTEVQNLVNTRLAQKISQVTGVGLVSLSGGQRPAVRIQADTQALSSYGIGLDTLRSAITAGQLQQRQGQLRRPEALLHDQRQRPAADGRRLQEPDRRLQERRAGADDRRGAAWSTAPRTPNSARGRTTSPAIILNVQRQPGANVIATVDAIKAQLPELQTALPGSVNVAVLTDRTTGIRASVEHVEIELVLAVVLVVLVIFAFLRSLRATVIASIAVPISLIGTCGAMYLLGYSLNNLSLMALTIATGFVVDDAIVMIENISRYIEEGEPPMQAALKGAAQIGFTIISLTVSLIAVLIPLLFMGDVVGRLFREFAVTLAITILISAVVSLTLVPMMSARWLKARAERPRAQRVRPPRRSLLRRRDEALRPLAALGLRAPGADAARGAGDAGADRAALHHDPERPVPDAGHRPAAGPRRSRARRVVRSAWRSCSRTAAKAILQDPEVQNLSSFIGVDAANNTMLHTGSMLINLKPDRGNQQATMQRLRERVQSRAGRHALPAADAGPDHRRRDRADPVPRCRSKAPTRRR